LKVDLPEFRIFFVEYAEILPFVMSWLQEDISRVKQNTVVTIVLKQEGS